MKIKENVTVYKCEHCGKNMFIQKAMVLHEQWCSKNPLNIKKCTFCEHMEETEVSYEVNRDSIGEGLGVIFDAYTETKKSKAFRCKKLDQLMYPTKVEKKGLPEMYPETFENQIPMPIECEHFKTFI